MDIAIHPPWRHVEKLKYLGRLFSLFILPNWLKVMSYFLSVMELAVEKPWAKMIEASDSNAQSWNLTALRERCPVETASHKIVCKEKFPGSERFGKYWVNHILVGLLLKNLLLEATYTCVCVLPMGLVFPSHPISPEPHIIRFSLDGICGTHHSRPGLLFNIWQIHVLLGT